MPLIAAKSSLPKLASIINEYVRPHNSASMQSDILAGVSVAALVIPQGMSYAKLAGLPSVYGLYGAFVPVLCYAALGTSRHLVSPQTCCSDLRREP